MKLLSRDQIESLSKFKAENFLTTSFYLDTDKSRQTKKEIALSLKNLLSDSKARLEAMDTSKEKKESLFKDLEKINKFCSENLGSYNFAGLAIFSCSNQNFWEIFDLPNPPRNRIIFDLNPYVRPLTAILDEYHCLCALLIDRREAKWYEIYMGEITLLEAITSDVPAQVKEGGFEGTAAKRIERHINAHLQEHFKKAAQITFDFFKKKQFDWLFLGSKDEYYSDLESYLHTYLRTRLKARLKALLSDSPDRVLKESLELEKKLKKEEEEEIVHRLVSELERGGLAVSGLRETLGSLNRYEAQTLVVTRNFSKPGRICPHCHLLFVDELRCTSCQRKTEPVLDVIDEAIEAAMKKNCLVKHIMPPSKLDRYGKIGAFLRYKV